MTGTPFDYDEVAMLLPFYANDSLNEADRARVDQALSASAELREELAEITALHSMVQAGGRQWEQERAPASADRLSHLLDQIETETPVQAAPARPERREIGAEKPQKPSFFASLFQPVWKPAFAAMALIALVQGVMLSRSNNIGGPDQGGFETASGPDDNAPINADQLHLILRFKENASWGEVSYILYQNDFVIEEGPTDGVIEIVAQGDMSASSKKALIDKLKTSPVLASVMEVN